MRLSPKPKDDLLLKVGIEKVLVRTGDEEIKWRDLPEEELSELKFGDLLSGKFRIVVRLRIEGQIMFVVTQEEDLENFRNKYPDGVVIHLKDLLGFFKGPLPGREDLIPNLLVGMACFPGAKVVG